MGVSVKTVNATRNEALDSSIFIPLNLQKLRRIGSGVVSAKQQVNQGFSSIDRNADPAVPGRDAEYGPAHHHPPTLPTGTAKGDNGLKLRHDDQHRISGRIRCL